MLYASIICNRYDNDFNNDNNDDAIHFKFLFDMQTKHTNTKLSNDRDFVFGRPNYRYF